MRYRELGKTGLMVSVVGFGGIPIQRTDAEGTKKVIDACVEAGINYIDTARGYTVSEEYLGYALEGRRDKFIIATKTMARDYEGMKRDIEISLKNLRTDYIDLYQIHNLKSDADFDLVFSANGAYRALLEAKEAGKIGHIGATVHSLDAYKKLIGEFPIKTIQEGHKALNEGRAAGRYGYVGSMEHTKELMGTYPIETIMFPFNIVESQGLETMRKSAEMGIGFIAMKPLAGGNITDGRLAMRYILNNPDCHVVIPGMADVEEVVENAGAADDTSPLSAEEQAACQKIRDELGHQFCRRCGYCAPCPQGIDIPTNFTFVNYLRNYGLADWARERYMSMKVNADSCVKCGICETRCPYELPIRDMLAKVSADMHAKA